MYLFIFQKLLRVVIILIGVTAIMFLLMHAIPGNPWSNYSNTPKVIYNLAPDKSVILKLNQRFGLDLPLWRQFTRYVIGDYDSEVGYICGLICGNLGPSIRESGRSVQAVLFEPPEGMPFWKSRFGYSIRLVFLATIFVIGLGLPLGIWSAMKPKSWMSRSISYGLAVLVSVPNFVFGLLAIIVFASWLKIIKVIPNWNDPRSWIIPAFVLAMLPMASLARLTRASMIDIMNEDFVRTARAKGLTQARTMLTHVLRNALVPIITFTGVVVMEMFTGLLIVENMYSFPGFGREYWMSVLRLDYPMILGMTVIYAIVLMTINMFIEFICEILDPRLRSVDKEGAA